MRANRKQKLGRGSLTPERVSRTETSRSQPWFQGYSNQELLDRQTKDEAVGTILAWKKSGTRPSGVTVTSTRPEVRHYWNYWDSLEVVNGLLFRRTHSGKGQGDLLKLITPKDMRKEIFRAYHYHQLSGHLGRKKTISKISQRFHWYELREDVKIWISQCDTCAAVKRPPRKLRAPIGDMRVGAPMDRLSIDILGPLPESRMGNRFILVINDAFTKWVEVFPLKDQTAASCAACLVQGVITRFGCPLELLSDQGRNFESTLFKELCKLLGIRKIRTSARHPQCNGQTERFNRTLLHMIKAYISGDQTGWDEYLNCFTSAYRATENETTGFTPNLMMLGRELSMPLEVVVCPEGIAEISYGDHVDTLRLKLGKAHEIVRQQLKKRAVRIQDRNNAKINLSRYKPGDLVWCLEVTPLGLSPKLHRDYGGPYLIVQRYNDFDYLLQKTRQGRRMVVHHDQLKPYNGNQKLNWAAAALRQTHRANNAP